MKILETKRDGVVVRVRVQLTTEELEPHFEKAFRRSQKSLKLDGFRPGKVPLEIIRKKYGDAIRAEAIDTIVEEVYPKVLEETGDRPITPGSIEDLRWRPGEPLAFTAIYELEPEFEVDKWKGLPVDREVVQITSEDVERQIESLRRDRAIISERDPGEGAEMGDRLNVDLQELDETGLPVIGRRSEGISFELGVDALGHGGDEQILGIKTGESRKIRTHRHVIDEQGKESSQEFGWEITVNKIEKIELPELDEDFVAMVNPELKTVDELNKDVEQQLLAYGRYLANQRLAKRLIDKVVESHPIELPPTLLSETLEWIVDSHREESQNMIPAEALREQLAPVAEKELRWYFIKRKLIETLGLEATDEEIDGELQRQAERGKTDLESLRLLFKSGERRDQLASEIVSSKLMEALIQAAVIEERPVPFGAVLS